VTLAKDLTVGETYFFRHDATFQALEKFILPEIIAKKAESDKKIRIWSAACCSGEEAFSVAMLLKKMISSIQDWTIEIIGTDINLDFLEKARTGLYKEWSFRNTSPSLKNQFFKPVENGQFLLNRDIRQMVKFDYLNLVEESYPSVITDIHDVDLILCSNVLIYFTPEIIKQVIDRHVKTLREEGWLVVSTVEVPFIEHVSFTPKKIGEVYFFQKNTLSHRKKSEPSIKKRILETKPKEKSHGAAASLALRRHRESDSIKKQSPRVELKGTVPVEKKDIIEVKGIGADLYISREYSQVTAKLESVLEPFIENKDKLKEMSTEIILLIKSYANQGNLIKAKEWSERSLRVNSLDPMLPYYYGMLLQETDCIEDALRAYKNAIFLDPMFIMCHFSLGGLLLLKDQNKDAKKHFRNVLELLKNIPPEDILPGSDDLTSERLKIITENLMKENKLA
jgi:chemotaxis protein methyltransferase CheR